MQSDVWHRLSKAIYFKLKRGFTEAAAFKQYYCFGVFFYFWPFQSYLILG